MVHFFQELLYEKHLSLDGSKLEETGFKCEHKQPTTGNLKEVCFVIDFQKIELAKLAAVDTDSCFSKVLQDYVKLGLFPPSLADIN